MKRASSPNLWLGFSSTPLRVPPLAGQPHPRFGDMTRSLGNLVCKNGVRNRFCIDDVGSILKREKGKERGKRKGKREKRKGKRKREKWKTEREREKGKGGKREREKGEKGEREKGKGRRGEEKFRIGFHFGENSAGFCKSVWLPGSILNFLIGSVLSLGGLIAATLFAAIASDSKNHAQT